MIPPPLVGSLVATVEVQNVVVVLATSVFGTPHDVVIDLGTEGTLVAHIVGFVGCTNTKMIGESFHCRTVTLVAWDTHPRATRPV